MKFEPHFNECHARIILGISIFAFLFRVAGPSLWNVTHGFGAYYTASRLVIESRAGILYDDAAFRAEVERNTDNRASDIFWANPPTTALMFLPIAFISAESARVTWIGFSVLCLLLTVVLMWHNFNGSSSSKKVFYLVLSGFLLSAPLYDNFKYGQAYVLVLVLYSLAFYALHFRMDWLAGFCIAMALALKASGVPLLILLAILGHWPLLARITICFGGGAIISLPLLHISLWHEYILYVIPAFLKDPTIAVTAYQTIPGFLRHLFTHHDIWNPAPIANWPALAVAANGLVPMGL
jgi:hypothetical protein